MVARPIVRRIQDNEKALNSFYENANRLESQKNQRILFGFPTVYIHNWEDTGEYEVYVGEANNIISRTRQHYLEKDNKEKWQHQLSNHEAELYIIGHEHFNKSLTLDVENRLIHYLSSVDCVRRVHNLRGNPQNQYYPVEELDPIFRTIWQELRRGNKKLFPSEDQIKDSAIFKASPLHKLTTEQEIAREWIVNRVMRAMKNDEHGQLIFVDGEAGTGKTVLNSSTFYELYCRAEESEEESDRTISCVLLVNHEEQVNVYKQIAKKLGLIDKYGDSIVSRPTSFINNHSKENQVDVAFVDEAHLLWTQGKQSYKGTNQLKDILERARVTVVMFDENQVLTTEQYWEKEELDQYRNQAVQDQNHIVLSKQLRMNADETVIRWIDAFTKQCKVERVPKSTAQYEIKVFDTPEELDDEITSKAATEDSALSRLIATYDWDYNANKRQKERLSKYWEVIIGKWHKPWNRELESELTRQEKRQIKALAWAEQPQTINEVGSTFTIQGFDLNYAGVILGPSVKYRNGKIVFDPSESCNNKATRKRTLSNGEKKKFGELLLQHEVRVLMTRGVNGLYIYACDEELRKALKEAVA